MSDASQVAAESLYKEYLSVTHGAQPGDDAVDEAGKTGDGAGDSLRTTGSSSLFVYSRAKAVHGSYTADVDGWIPPQLAKHPVSTLSTPPTTTADLFLYKNNKAGGRSQ